jgi:hypothetical protein
MGNGREMMRIRFGDTGEIYQVVGERRQFWLFNKNGEIGKAVKGSDAYTLLDGDAPISIPEYNTIVIRDELSGFGETEENLDDNYSEVNGDLE